MNIRDRKERFSLTVLLATVIMVFIIVTNACALLTGFILIKTGLVSVGEGANLSLGKTVLLFACNSLVLGAILSGTVGKLPLKPVNKIITQMNRLASGDFKARLRFKGRLAKHPVAVEVCDSFNKMAEELENTEMLRSDFINNFSHEFKTPIVSVAGFAKLLKRGNLTEEQKAEYIDIIEEESLRLAAMATNVMNLTKYENQTILSDVQSFNLSEQIRSSILSLEGKWSKKKIEFSLNFSEYTVEGNKDMLRQVWINLIDNAIKFSPDGATVVADIKDEGKTYLVSVSNNGVQIPADRQKKIFNKFYQADESHSSEGNGIGLALVKSAVELHGGTVWVTSENGLTVFSVRLPKGK